MTAPADSPPIPRAAAGAGPTRLAGAAGLAAAGALIASFVVLPVDDGGTSAADIAARYAADGYVPAVVLQAAGVVAGLVFAAGTAAVLRTAGGPGSALPPLVLAGGAVAAALQLVGYAVIATLAVGTAGRAAADVVLALYDLSSVAFAFGSAGWAVCLAAVGVGIARTRVAGRWAGWLAGTAAIPSLVAAGSLASGGFFGVHGDLGFLAVVLVHLAVLGVGVSLLRGQRSWRESSTAPTA